MTSHFGFNDGCFSRDHYLCQSKSEVVMSTEKPSFLALKKSQSQVHRKVRERRANNIRTKKDAYYLVGGGGKFLKKLWCSVCERV